MDLPHNIAQKKRFSDDDLSNLSDDFQGNDDLLMLLDDEVIHCNDYVLVKYPTKRRTLHFIGTVESCNKDDYVVNFLRKYKSGFRFPDLQDVSNVSREDISVSKIPNPEAAPGTSRISSVLKFNVNFDGYNIQ